MRSFKKSKINRTAANSLRAMKPVVDGLNFYDNYQENKKRCKDSKRATVATVVQYYADDILGNNPVDLVVGLGSSALSLVGKDERAQELNRFSASSISKDMIQNAYQDDADTTVREVLDIVDTERKEVSKQKNLW
ncbi:MAG: hypothetical protein GXP45_02520 [bacterium]|nr:hypothetical protein [bacterium]